jgi:hypothetical protein
MWISQEERGAGNNWANGYAQADSVNDVVFDIINREVDNCDNLEGFVLLHSVAGILSHNFFSNYSCNYLFELYHNYFCCRKCCS